jgi:hypothetical protein
MSSYYLGGYFLIKLRAVDFSALKCNSVYTCSTCINDTLIDSWSYSWTTDNNSQINSVLKDFDLELDKISKIRSWVDKKHDEEHIGWQSVFSDLETAILYKKTFFSHLDDILIMGIYFDASESLKLLKEFETNKIGLYKNLNKKVPENQYENEELIGFDLIGIESSGDFHTFYCHDISNDLTNKFNLEINSYGLLNDSNDWEHVLDYMNDEETGLEPVPWFSVKVKLIKE